MSTTSVVNRVPTEVLSQIFRIGSELHHSHDWFNRNTARSQEQYLKTITSTCALWRNTAPNDPLLWSMIEFDQHRITEATSPEYHEFSKATVEKIEVFLVRSKTASLRIHLNWGEWGNPMIRTLQLIRPHLERCEFLQICVVDPHKAPRNLLFPLPGSMHRLVELQVECPSSSEQDVIPLFSEDGYPQLAKLHLWGQVRCFSVRGGPSRLQSLSIGGATFRSDIPVRLLARNSPTLELLDWNISNIVYNLPTPTELPNLKTLVTRFESLPSIPEIVTCPGIIELKICEDHISASNDAEDLQIRPNHFNLHSPLSLELYGGFYITAVEMIFLAFPNVTKLTADLSNVPIGSLANRDVVPILYEDLEVLPNLSLLRFKNSPTVWNKHPSTKLDPTWVESLKERRPGLRLSNLAFVSNEF